MGLFPIIILAVGLAMDSLAVSLAAGTTLIKNQIRPILRLTLHLSLFQGGLTVIGWLAGTTIAPFIEKFDHWVIFGLLLWVGGHMVWEGLHPEQECFSTDPTRGKVLVMLCLATSLDAVAVGLSLALINVNIVLTGLVIFLVTLVFSLAGVYTGNALGDRFGKRVEILGGLILVAIGIRVLIEHML